MLFDRDGLGSSLSQHCSGRVMEVVTGVDLANHQMSCSEVGESLSVFETGMSPIGREKPAGQRAETHDPPRHSVSECTYARFSRAAAPATGGAF
jgi:hypothetical protein